MADYEVTAEQSERAKRLYWREVYEHRRDEALKGLKTHAEAFKEVAAAFDGENPWSLEVLRFYHP